MALHGTFLQSRVARQLLGLFLICSLLPMVLLGLGVFAWERGREVERATERLRIESKQIGMNLFERLAMLEQQLGLYARTLSGGCEPCAAYCENAGYEAQPTGFHSVVVDADCTREGRVLAGEFSGRTPWSSRPEQLPALLAVGAGEAETGLARIFMAVESEGAGSGFAVGEIDPDFLWAPLRHSGKGARSAVIMDRGAALYRSDPADGPMVLKASRTTGSFDWELSGAAQRANAWSLFLGGAFPGAGAWRVVYSEPLEDLEHSSRLVSILALMILGLFMSTTFLLSMFVLRRRMAPLDALTDGTVRFGEGKLGTRIEVSSDDEFGALAGAFNQMAQRVERQITLIRTSADIDRAILSSLSQEVILSSLLDGLKRITGSDAAMITIQDPVEERAQRTLVAGPESFRAFGSLEEAVRESPAVRAILHDLERELTPVYGHNREVAIDGRVAGVVSLAKPAVEVPYAGQAVERVLQQVAIALKNSRLLARVEQSNRETLEALALAIDAKSRWTAGHSTRVTDMALRLARKTGADAATLERLSRGGPLHDIGKIGVSAEVLDKPGRLTPEEFDEVKQHPVIGVRLLAPLSAFHDVLPIVRQHHERWDGKGYPDGLAGEAIHPDARILAVADVFDALIADRPYRAAMPIQKVRSILLEGAGTQFAPGLVEAFLEMLDEQELDAGADPLVVPAAAEVREAG